MDFQGTVVDDIQQWRATGDTFMGLDLAGDHLPIERGLDLATLNLHLVHLGFSLSLGLAGFGQGHLETPY
ncbi:hypothetical protein D3C85_1628050 [compost metagenome]